MKFKLSQITVLVVSALSVSAGVAATINDTVNINNSADPIITGKYRSDNTVKYSGSISNSPNTITFVGRESDREGDMYYSHRTENDGSLTRIGVNYDYEYFYSAVEADPLAITDSSVRINGKADNLTIGGKSVVTITGSDAYNKYRGADYENPSNPQSTLPLYRNSYDNNRRDEITVSTGNGTYNDESKQYLDGEHIGDVKKPDNSNATLTIKGTDVTDARLGADKGEYLVATGDNFNGKAEQHVGERSLPQGATFNRQSSQHLKGKDGKKAVSLDATFTGTAGVKHTGQTVGSNGLAIDSTFDYANQDISSGGVAKNNTLRNGDQNVSGEAKNNTLNGDIDMIVEANGKATGKTTFNGKNHLDLYAATTNGAYVEDLALSRTKGKSSVTVYEGTQEHDAVTIGTLNGKAAVNFDHRTNPAGHAQMNINNLGNNDPAPYDNTMLDFTMNSNILNGNSGFINTDNAYGQHYVTIIERDTDKEAVLNRPQSADFAYVKNVAGDSNAVFGMKDADGKILDLMDAGTYIHNIQTRTGANNDTTWSFTATDRLTPSARAVLALSSAPQLMYNNEVDHLRARLHMLRTSDSIENGLWMQGIGSNTKVDKDQIQYKLRHAGLELGADYPLALNSDSKLVLGGFTGFDKGDVKNDRAGTSDNHFDNKLKTTSTNGYDISSDNYSTSVWGMALETGYTFTFSNQTLITPYGQLAYNRMGSKDITLNNGMDAAIKSQTSFTSELGVNAGKDFSFDSGLVFSPYVKAAWNHQYEDGNEVEFNRYNTINLDLSGSTGKFGAGFNARYNNVNMFMELQHIAGDAVYSPINGQVALL